MKTKFDDIKKRAMNAVSKNDIDISKLSEEELIEKIYKYEVHQLELEMQIDKLIAKNNADKQPSKRDDIRLQSALASMSDLLFILDENGIFIDYSISNDEEGSLAPTLVFLGNHFKDIFPKDVANQFEKAFQQIKLGESTQQFDYSIKLQGAFVWYNAKFSVNKNSSNQFAGVTVILRNINKQKKAELALKKSEQSLKTANDTKDKFFSIIAHDYST